MQDVIDYIQKNEGLRLQSYQDTTGNWTIGYGHNLAVDGGGASVIWTKEHADDVFQIDFLHALTALQREMPWVKGLTSNRWMAMCDLSFNLGIYSLKKFTTFLMLMQSEHFANAAHDLLQTEYCRQVPNRAKSNANLILLG